MEERNERVGIEADDVLRRLAALAFLDPGDVVRWGADQVTVLESSELTPEQRAAVGEVRVKRNTIGKMETVETMIKLRDPMPALALLAKHVGLTPESPSLPHERIPLIEAVARMSDEEIVALVQKVFAPVPTRVLDMAGGALEGL